MEEMIAKYNVEKARIEKIAETTKGGFEIMKVYKNHFHETSLRLHDAIHEVARLAAFCDIKLI